MARVRIPEFLNSRLKVAVFKMRMNELVVVFSKDNRIFIDGSCLEKYEKFGSPLNTRELISKPP